MWLALVWGGPEHSGSDSIETFGFLKGLQGHPMQAHSWNWRSFLREEIWPGTAHRILQGKLEGAANGPQELMA